MTRHDERKRGFSFLFRTDQGEIARAAWWKGLAAILAPLIVLTLIWLALEPFATRVPPKGAVIDPAGVIAYVYLLFYAFAVMIAAVCYYNLSAKRFRARGRPASLAGLIPFGLLVVGAALWLQPRSEGFVSPAVSYALEALTAALAIWAVIDLGFMDDKRLDDGELGDEETGS